MCGIAGFVDPRLPRSPHALADAMGRPLAHRGPDDYGLWADESRGVGFAHCRLSIIDLSGAGHQPMLSQTGRYVLTYNGEIYNHEDLRREIGSLKDSPAWRGHSDTEVLLTAIERWGLKPTLERVNGMFAFALWDRERDTLFLARDRLGEKPLYYGVSSGIFMFASELTAMRSHPEWRGEVDHNALALYLRFGYVPAPWSIFKGIYKLGPGHLMSVRQGGRLVDPPVSYWSLDRHRLAKSSPDQPFDPDEFHDLLTESVRLRMTADVPVGSFLSGGVDSSTVTALMQAQSSTPIQTFTIGFREAEFNEADHARQVAQHLGTDHTELIVDSSQAIGRVPELPEVWDEPFADPSQIPTLALSQLAREQVKVVLSGDGGDELFHGYRRYRRSQRLWGAINVIPPGLRKSVHKLVANSSLSFLDKALLWTKGLNDIRPLDQRREILAGLMSEGTQASFYERVISLWDAPASVVIADVRQDSVLASLDRSDFTALSELMMWVDTHLYLPNDILVKLDRATMAHGLEGRIPLLDHRVVEFAWRIPIEMRAGRDPKRFLRNVLYQYVPKEIVDRPKMGFGIPIESWLKGPLRGWAEELISTDRLKRDGYLDPDVVRKAWSDHLEGRARNHYRIWTVLMFQAWVSGLHRIEKRDSGRQPIPGR